jgi:hypothetical protein
LALTRFPDRGRLAAVGTVHLLGRQGRGLGRLLGRPADKRLCLARPGCRRTRRKPLGSSNPLATSLQARNPTTDRTDYARDNRRTVLQQHSSSPRGGGGAHRNAETRGGDIKGRSTRHGGRRADHRHPGSPSAPPPNAAVPSGDHVVESRRSASPWSCRSRWPDDARASSVWPPADPLPPGPTRPHAKDPGRAH